MPPDQAPRRRRRAILVVDVVESVRLMRLHEEAFIGRWRRFTREVQVELLPVHGGRLVKSLGDGMLLDFRDAHAALAAGLALRDFVERHRGGTQDPVAFALRMGLHVAEVIVDELDIYGAGVNLAARLAELSRPGDITISPEARDECLDGLDAVFEDLGEVYLKHIDEPVHAIRVHASSSHTGTMQARAWPADRLDGALASVAVMPFGGLSADSPMGELIADSVIAHLSRSDSLRVISRLSSSALATRSLSSGQIGELLGCDHLLAGRCLAVGSRRLVTAELTIAATGEVLWADRIESSEEELLSPDDPVTREIAWQAVRAMLERSLRHAVNTPLPSLQDFSLLLSGMSLMHRSPPRDFERAGEVLQHLVGRRPRAAQPWALLAQWRVLRVTRGLCDDTAAEARHALDHTRRAAECDAENALAPAVEGFVHCHLLKDLAGAQSRLDRALTIKPNEPLAWLFQCVVDGFRGDGERAWNSARRAISLSPLDPMRPYFDGLAASAALAAGLLNDAVMLAERSLRLNRNHLPTLRALTIARVERGELALARELGARVVALDPDFSLRTYMSGAPRGAAASTRERYSMALRAAGLPP